MTIVNLEKITPPESKSPGGKYRSFRTSLSEALGRDPDSLDLNKRHPFDFTLARIPPGAALCPYHAHSAQWELYLVVAGQGLARDESGTTQIVAGDAFLYMPGEAHQLSNPGTEDLVYYVLADNPIGESCYYPDSRKWSIRGADGSRVLIRGEPADYFDGEE